MEAVLSMYERLGVSTGILEAVRYVMTLNTIRIASVMIVC
jgi:hypothetical protein